MFPNKKEDIIDGEPYLDFLFSDPSQCNDPQEVAFFTNSLYTGSDKSNQLKNEVEAYQKIEGNPFVFCLIRHRRAIVQKCPLTEIPMWNMYGDKNCGIRLKFDYKSLDYHCKNNNIQLFPCMYLDRNGMQKETQTIREDMNNLIEIEARNKRCRDLYKQYVRYKTLVWSYESEYRMAVWRKDYNEIEGKNRVHVKIPLKCLKEIQIGSSADIDISNTKIESLRGKMNQLGISTEFKVNTSKILIRLGK